MVNPDESPVTSRRAFLHTAASGMAAAGVALALPPALNAEEVRAARHDTPASAQLRGYVDLLRAPDSVLAQTATGELRLVRSPDGKFRNNDVVVSALSNDVTLRVSLAAPATAIKRIHLRWNARLGDARLILGDAWERGYGDLEWRGFAADRVMPWYAATFDGALTHAYGVRTGAKAFCFWQIDGNGISLWGDVRSGGVGVQLGERQLEVCDVVSRAGRAGETSFAALHSFCKQMCTNPRLPSQPVYGSNDWYWVYGKNSAESVRVDAQHIVELSPIGRNRPFAVIDDGWQPERGKDKAGVGTWDHGNEKFGDMARMAAEIRTIGARPGVWIRPLQATKDMPDTWRLSRDKQFMDPSVPEVRQKVADDIARLRQWGFELIKHDYTTYDIFGRWGNTMGSAMTRDGWTFATGSSHTTAEIIDDLYAGIRKAADTSLVIGCNTISHLSAGHFEICRVGDDTSGTEWSRTRKMGVNTLAFRGVQHDAFYVADADCVGVTNALPWELNRQWLDLLARSGTMTFLSLAPDALGAEQRKDIKAALALAAVPHPLAEPLDWQAGVYPSRWRSMGAERTYDWVGPNGAGSP